MGISRMKSMAQQTKTRVSFKGDSARMEGVTELPPEMLYCTGEPGETVAIKLSAAVGDGLPKEPTTFNGAGSIELTSSTVNKIKEIF